MPHFDATSYYANQYGNASAEDWHQWHSQGAWPSARDKQEPLQFSIGDGHGVVYHMLHRRRPLKRVLDIGCSAGNFLLPVRKMCEQAYGVDIAQFPGAWDVLRGYYGIECQCFDIDKGALPFPDAYFSAVTMIMTLEHVFNVHHAIAEISRVLEPGGVTIVQVPNIAYAKIRVELLLGRIPITADREDRDFAISWDGQHLHNFTLHSLNKLFLLSGLNIEECRCFGKLAKLRSLWPSLWGADLTVAARKGLRRLTSTEQFPRNPC